MLEMLTDARVKSLTEVGRHADTNGLYIVIRKSGGRKSWLLIMTHKGRRHERALGFYPEIGLRTARDRAAEVKGQIKAGLSQKHGEAPALIPVIPLFGVFAKEAIDGFADSFRNKKHREQWYSTLEMYCQPIWSKPVDAVSTDDIASLLNKDGFWTKKAETASRVRGRIERVLNVAKARKLRSGENPAGWKDNLDAILGSRKKLQRGHHAAIAYAAIPALWQKLDRLDSVSSAALRLVVLTAARSGEVRGATWDEFDLTSQLWTVPAERMKMNKEHRVPLSDAAVAIVKRMAEFKICDFVFPGFHSKRPLSDMALLECLRGAASGYTVHGMRSSFRDWAGDETGHQRETIEAALAHSLGDATERAYRRADALDKRRRLMDDWAAYVIEPPSLPYSSEKAFDSETSSPLASC